MMQETDRQASDHVVEQALHGLRHEIDVRVQEAARQTATVPETEWLEIVELLRRRFNTLGMMERSSEVDEFGMDALAVRGTLPAFDFLLERYWRVSLSGVELIPLDGPVLFAVKCLTALPCDPLLVAHAAYRRAPRATGDLLCTESKGDAFGDDWVRFLIAPRWSSFPFVQAFATRLGGLPASFANAQRLLQKGYRVACSRAEESAIKAAISLGVPIVPVTLESVSLVSRAMPFVTPSGVDCSSTPEDFSFVDVLREIGFLALPLHWSLQFEFPRETL